MINNHFPKRGGEGHPQDLAPEPAVRPRRPLPVPPVPNQPPKLAQAQGLDGRDVKAEQGVHPVVAHSPMSPERALAPQGANAWAHGVNNLQRNELGGGGEARRVPKGGMPQGPNWRVGVAPIQQVQPAPVAPAIDYHKQPLPPLPKGAVVQKAPVAPAIDYHKQPLPALPVGAKPWGKVSEREKLDSLPKAIALPVAQRALSPIAPPRPQLPSLGATGWAPRSAPRVDPRHGVPAVRVQHKAHERIKLLGPNARIEPNTGSKIKFDGGLMRRLGYVASSRYSRLESSASGLKLTLTATLARGSFGKVRLARSDDGTMLAVKELRTVQKAGVSKMGRPRTHAATEAQMMREAVDTQYLRGVIDREMAVFDQPNGTTGRRMQGIRQGTTPFEVIDMIKVPETGKVFMVMTREAGDVQTLHEKMPDALRPFAALSLSAQGFSEISILHGRAGMAHMDIKLENFLFNDQGQMKLMDFGLVKPLRAGQTQVSGRVGSLLSPEMVQRAPNDPTKRAPLGSANDVWAMAASILEISQPLKKDIPFYVWPPIKDSAHRDAEAQRMLRGYGRWQDSLRATPNGPMDIRRIRPDEYFGAQFYALAKSHPELCHILLNDALVLDPKLRQPAHVIAGKIRALLPADETRAASTLRKTMADLDEASNNLNRLRGETAHFAAWAKNRPSEDAPKARWQGARNLPR